MTKEKLEQLLVEYGVPFTSALADRLLEERRKEWRKVIEEVDATDDGVNPMYTRDVIEIINKHLKEVEE